MLSDDWRKLYPFSSNWMTVDGWRLHFLDEGRGEPLLMVHGNPTWSFYWRNLITPLRERYRIVAPDHIGCGLSDKPAKYPYTLARHIDNLVQLIRELDLRDVTLLAHDWGGAIGLGAAVELPDRFARLVLFNTAAFPPPYIPLRLRICRWPIFGRMAIQGFNLFARAALSMATEKPERLTPAVRAGLLAPYDSWPHRVATYRFVRDIPTSRRHPTWKTLAAIEAALPRLADRPVTMIWGTQDWCFNVACLERMSRYFPQAEIHRVEDAGHYVVEDAHERIAPWVDQFVQAHPLAVPSRPANT